LNQPKTPVKLAAERPFSTSSPDSKTYVIRALIAWGPAVTWATVLFVLSEIGTLPPIVWLALHDKLVHLGLYGVLGGTLAWGYRASEGALPHWATIGVGIAYGAVDELHQQFVPNRVPSVGDFAADVVGVLIGYSVVLVVWAAAHRTQSS